MLLAVGVEQIVLAVNYRHSSCGEIRSLFDENPTVKFDPAAIHCRSA